MRPNAPSDPTKTFLSHRGRRLAYTLEGPPGPTVLAVPGLPGRIRDFRWLAPALSGAFAVARVELPGFGASEREGYSPMGIDDRAAPVHAVLTHLLERGHRPVHLLGHSAGATTVAHLASTGLPFGGRAALVSPTGLRPHYPAGMLRALAPVFRRRAGRAALAPILRRLYAAQGFPRYLNDDERVFTTLDAAATNFALHRANLAALRVPTLIAWAADDRLISDEMFSTVAAVATPGPRLRFDEGGHNIQKTKATELAEALAAHFTGRPLSADPG
ncbi:MAG: alpha/beta hydrolase [Myxococcota bacterium]